MHDERSFCSSSPVASAGGVSVCCMRLTRLLSDDKLAMSSSCEVKDGFMLNSYNRVKAMANGAKSRRWSPLGFALRATESVVLRSARLVGFKDASQVDDWVTRRLSVLEQLTYPLLKSLKALVDSMHPVKRLSLFLHGLVLGRSKKVDADSSPRTHEDMDGKEEATDLAAATMQDEAVRGGKAEEQAVYEEADEIRAQSKSLNGSLDMKELGDDIVRRGEELVKDGSELLQNFLQTIQNSPARR